MWAKSRSWFWCRKTEPYKDIAYARMPECMLGSNCMEKQTDPGVHSLNFTCLGS